MYILKATQNVTPEKGDGWGEKFTGKKGGEGVQTIRNAHGTARKTRNLRDAPNDRRERARVGMSVREEISTLNMGRKRKVVFLRKGAKDPQ